MFVSAVVDDLDKVVKIIFIVYKSIIALQCILYFAVKETLTRFDLNFQIKSS